MRLRRDHGCREAWRSGPTSIYRKGRQFTFSLIRSPLWISSGKGSSNLAAKNELKTVAVMNADDVGGRAMRQSAIRVVGLLV
jgi:hypothetical protein